MGNIGQRDDVYFFIGNFSVYYLLFTAYGLLGRRLVAGPRILDPVAEVRLLPPQCKGLGLREKGLEKDFTTKPPALNPKPYRY